MRLPDPSLKIEDEINIMCQELRMKKVVSFVFNLWPALIHQND